MIRGILFELSILLFIVSLFEQSYAAESCEQCINSGKKYCATFDACDISPCLSPIDKSLNCPRLPSKENAYNESFARKQIFLLAAAAFTNHPDKCFANQMPTMNFFKSVNVSCANKGPEVTCFGYTAYDESQKVIVMSFRGTEGGVQLMDEILDFFTGKKPFFDAGNIFTYFYDAFYFLWNGGLEPQIRTLKYRYPDYQLWVTGHSLGAAIASIAASHVVKVGIFNAANVRLVTFGQPRTGDYQYAQWHEDTFPYSYRIVHHKDPVPHVPPQNGKDELFHHRTEIWYNNNMTVGSPYSVCKEADGLYCSNMNVDDVLQDHLYYFATQISDWGGAGCPKS